MLRYSRYPMSPLHCLSHHCLLFCRVFCNRALLKWPDHKINLDPLVVHKKLGIAPLQQRQLDKRSKQTHLTAWGTRSSSQKRGCLDSHANIFFFPKVGGGVQNRGVLRIVKIQYILVGLALLWHFVLLWRKRKPNLYYFLTLPRRRLRPVVTIFYASGVTRGQFGVRSYDASILCLMYCLPLNFVLRMNEAH